MARIYLTGSGPNRGYHTGSGILSLPVRLQLQDKDHRIGSYPTMARTGDADFTGIYNSTYDDTNTVLFTPGQLVYPMNLPASSRFISGNISTPSILQGLTAGGTSSAGTADIHASFTSGQSISPFNESRLYLDNDSAFYATGTAPSVLAGFDQRLGSKTIVTIDISPTSATDVGFSTGSATEGYAVNSGLSYFNFANKRWEVIGDLTAGSNVDYFNQSNTIATASLLSVSPSSFWDSNFPWLNLGIAARSHGAPCDSFGFPLASKFNATGSQLFSTSASIAAPLFVEKWRIDFSGTIRQPTFNPFKELAVQSTFILMLQREQVVSSSIEVEFQETSNTVYGDSAVHTHKSYHSVTKDRRIIGYLRIGRFTSGSGSPTYDQSEADFSTSYPNIHGSCDRWYPSENKFSSTAASEALTGRFSISGSCKTPAKTPSITPYLWLRDSDFTNDAFRFLGKSVGSRNMFDISDGRSFIKSVVGANVSSSLSLSPGGGYPDFPGISYETDSEISPFLLLPKDKLVLAYAHQMSPAVDDESLVASLYNTIEVGPAQLTLYGSLLRNNLPVEPESNQPLTSDAIHEDLHYDNPIYDQWDVEPITSLTGSYVDLIITGSMLATPLADPNAANVRKVQASCAAGQAGTTGSLQRFVRLEDSLGGRVYDSFVPDPFQYTIAASNGVATLQSFRDPTTNPVAFGEDSSATTIDNFVIPKSTPFEPKFSTLSRVFSHEKLKTAIIFVQSTIDNPGGNDPNMLVPNNINSNHQLKLFFGFGNGILGLAEFAKLNSSPPTTPMAVVVSNAYDEVIIRGYKYGLAGLFGSAMGSRYRRDRYGQFRDMLEQRQYPALLQRGGTVEYPVTVTFVSREGGITSPEKTHSQNLSPYVTSSLPYYDGLTKDRSDNPDNTLRPTSIEYSLT